MTPEEQASIEMDESYDKIHFRYGVIGIQDMRRDLQHWETLLTSSMLQRPVKVIIDEPFRRKISNNSAYKEINIQLIALCKNGTTF